MRIAVISLDDKPECFKPVDDIEIIWIKAKKDNVGECIKAAIRMRVDKMEIVHNCFGLFSVS